MINIGDRLKEAIDYMDRKSPIEYALTPTCIALDLTAKKVARKDKSSRSDYKDFISDYMWLITYMGLPGILAGQIKIKFSHPDIKNDSKGYCGIEDIVYHVIRCGLIHSTGLDSRIRWEEGTVLGTDNSGILTLSSKFIWGLIGAIVFCPQNRDEKIGKTYWISIGDFKFFIQEVWGRVDLAKQVISMNSKSHI